MPLVGMGTGFVWDAAGHLVTNYHVIHGASRAQVRVGCISREGAAEGHGLDGLLLTYDVTAGKARAVLATGGRADRRPAG
jgi:S1-C subfamily serine protease